MRGRLSGPQTFAPQRLGIWIFSPRQQRQWQATSIVPTIRKRQLSPVYAMTMIGALTTL